MPFAKNSRAVAGRFQQLRHRRRIQAHPLSFEDGVSYAGFEFMPTGHQRATRRCARWTDSEVGQTNALLIEVVDLWSFQDRIAMTAQIAVTLVIRKYKDDVGGGR